MIPALRVPFVLLALFGLSAVGCTTPDAVSKFCGSATTTLASAAPIFEDLKLSCLREVNSRTGIGTFTSPLTSNASCDEIGVQADGAEAAAQLLSNYFEAINSLASFDTAKAGTDTQALASKAGAAFKASPEAQTAIGSIAQFLTATLTSGYKERQLEKDLPAVAGNITNVLNGLVTIVQRNYIDQLLKSEDEKLTDNYKEYVRNNNTGEVKLLLDDRWHADEQAIAAKRASAQSLITAFNALSKGTTDLATSAHTLKAKELPGLLDPYVTQIQSLIPQIQKGF